MQEKEGEKYHARFKQDSGCLGNATNEQEQPREHTGIKAERVGETESPHRRNPV